MNSENYEQVWAGEPFEEPKGKYWKLACCHCGLVHEIRIEDSADYEDTVSITMRENAAATKRHRKASPDLQCKPVKATAGKGGKRRA